MANAVFLLIALRVFQSLQLHSRFAVILRVIILGMHVYVFRKVSSKNSCFFLLRYARAPNLKWIAAELLYSFRTAHSIALCTALKREKNCCKQMVFMSCTFGM